MTNVLICGANGTMGQVLADEIASSEHFQAVAGVDLFADRYENAFPVYTAIKDVTEPCDIIIDFSKPAALYDNLAYAKERRLPIIIATTGYNDMEKQAIRDYSEFIPVFFSANMSLGVNLLIDLCRQAAGFFGDSANVEIVEKHHNLKTDAPSGTALAIAEAINLSLGGNMDYQFGRAGNQAKRQPNEIGLHAIRGGRIVGEHSALFITNEEELELHHRSENKHVFAAGALRAAEYILPRPAGLYSMQDIVFETRTVTSLHLSMDEAIITVSDIPGNAGLVAGIFDTIAARGINVDIITQSAPKNGRIELSFSVSGNDLDEAVNALKAFDPSLSCQTNSGLTKITVEGVGMEQKHGVAAKLFSSLARSGVDILLVTTSETKVSFCTRKEDADSALRAISEEFNLQKNIRTK